MFKNIGVATFPRFFLGGPTSSFPMDPPSSWWNPPAHLMLRLQLLQGCCSSSFRNPFHLETNHLRKKYVVELCEFCLSVFSKNISIKRCKQNHIGKTQLFWSAFLQTTWSLAYMMICCPPQKAPLQSALVVQLTTWTLKDSKDQKVLAKKTPLFMVRYILHIYNTKNIIFFCSMTVVYLYVSNYVYMFFL